MGPENHQTRLASLCLGHCGADELDIQLGIGLKSLIDQPPWSRSPSDALFESSDAIAAVCLGVASGILLSRFPTRFLNTSYFQKRAPVSQPSQPGHVPPISWVFTADQETCDDVQTILSAAFEMASKSPIRSRDQAFREASFYVPYEIARLNPDAPRFRVEDMGVMPPLKKLWKDMDNLGFHVTAPFDVEKEARVFLYFPNDAPRATAAFLAINTEFHPVGQPNSQGKVTTPEDQDKVTTIASIIWICQNINWRRHHPHVLDRIEPGHLPVIMSFRETACGSSWDTHKELFTSKEAHNIMVNLTKITS
ncbi:hypothetical protein INS49_004280 [Diaporthe citri]|uniref:uncharacterized protein n=1 Tax=Diaporthe citri TaxID=83186 RepID=UPI001C7F11F1|nr:uncharacterized protein INS49_004280 [Diaporthe citri]KAG6355199.1 hypothetical protein INS49_004280 [Diaporthe citri]